MRALPARWVVSPRRPAGVWLAAGAVTLVLLAVGALSRLPTALAPAGPANAPLSAAQRAEHAFCLEGAGLMHDVRWASACMDLGNAGQGDGDPECELPPERAAKLYALLVESEQQCRVDALRAPAP